MAMIKGICIILVDKVINGYDEFNEPIYIDKYINIDNVLVCPSVSDDIINAQDLYGKKAIYTLAIPKNDNHNWQNKEVIFFNQKFKTFGIPIEGISKNIPLDWNKKVMVERYE